jgi:alanine racemase
MNPPSSVPGGIYRETLAIVDLDAIAHNLQEIRSLLPHAVAICAIVKANAYGHGAIPVSRELETQGVEAFGVATVEEGLELRQAGIRRPILVMGASFSGIEAAQEQALTPVVYSPDTAVRISEAARRTEKPLAIHLKVDTGMGRIGLLMEDWRPVLEELLANPWVRVEGLMSHFSSAESDDAFTRNQLDRFERAVQQIHELGQGKTRHLHIANSAGILNHPESSYTMVRPGILLYGVYPERELKGRCGVRPSMTFKTRVLYVKSLPAGSPVSYGQTFVTKRPSRIATLPVGYADGYRRALSNRGRVLIRGKTAPVVGNVTMDLTLVDLTDIPDASEGDEVILFGNAGDTCLPVEDLAAELHTIPYELLCAVSQRVPRVYRRDGKVVDER